MKQQAWAHRSPPVPDAGTPSLYCGEPASAAEVSAGRAELRTAVIDSTGSTASAGDDLDRLMLVFEELVSNGLRHGSPPVQVTVTGTAGGWLLEVSDAAFDRPPTPPVGRDPSTGGMGLNLVAALCPAHGWDVHAGRKVVWGCLERAVVFASHG
jgi:hypothetical protein